MFNPWLVAKVHNYKTYYVQGIDHKKKAIKWTPYWKEAFHFSNSAEAGTYKNTHLPNRPEVFIVHVDQTA